MSAELGILYVATGADFVREAIVSAASVRRIMPGVSCTIYADSNREIPDGLFDQVVVLNNVANSYADKIEPLIQTPYEKTLFLDTDTEMIEPVPELARLLERFDLACCHAPYRHSGFTIPDCPDGAFPELNTGVILFKKCRSVFDLFGLWSQIYREQRLEGQKPPHDQPAFRSAVYKSSVNFTILPPEYNLRTLLPYFAGGNAKVKILHGREPSLSEARHTINATSLVRIGEPSSKRQTIGTIADGVAIAMQLLQANRLSEAEQLCRRILMVESQNAEALRLLELISARRNQGHGGGISP